MDSYCGGAVAALGGSLVIGAAVRLGRQVSWRPALLGSLGLIVLANSRPFEGLFVFLGATLVTIWWRRRTPAGIRGLLSPQVLVPAMLLGVAAIGWLAYYNFRTTGQPLQMPYVVNNKMYAASSQFWFMPDMTAPEYRHEVIRNIWQVWTRGYWVRARHNPLLILPDFIWSAKFFWSQLGCAVLFAGVLIARSPKVWSVMAVFAAMLFGLALQVSVAAHYFAPGFAALLAPQMYAVRWLRVAGRRFGPALVMLLMGLAVHQAFRADTFHNWQESPSRREVIRALTKQGGRHVVFVRYAAEHKIVRIDMVSNAADIDASQIVWARYMGEQQDRELIRYYPDRQAWIWDADAHPLLLRPYSQAEAP
jgi:hypothetical protein